MNKAVIQKQFREAVEEMRKSHADKTYYWLLDTDCCGNQWAIVLGFSDGFEEDSTDDCVDGTYRLCVKLAYQPYNSIMQCDYDIDWLLPYDEESGEVDDNEVSIYPDSNLEEIINQLMESYKYNVIKSALKIGGK